MEVLKPVEPNYAPEHKEAMKKSPLRLWEPIFFLASYATAWIVLSSSLKVYGVKQVPADLERQELGYFSIACWILGTIACLELIPLTFTIASLIRYPDIPHLHFKMKVSTIQLSIVTVIMTSYFFQANSLVPTFIDPITQRRVYGMRFCEWTMAAPMYTYMVGRILFQQPLNKVVPCMVVTALYLQMGLWAAIYESAFVRWGWVTLSYIGYFMSAYWLSQFLTGSENERERVRRPDEWVKRGLLFWNIFFWGSYGLVFHAAQVGLIGSEWEQLMYTSMDCVAKMTTSVCLIALRSAEWEVVLLEARHAAETARHTAAFEMQLNMLKLQLENKALETELSQPPPEHENAAGLRQRA
uniref:Uncharacterized protein n=1 Tax=Chromera velia CCMP2878 TaxID=1169474 RepID=A0A0G4GEQ8_9ALVE|eukprot:Cvel_4599.t1-p1 / transcript=Cvel_4599.t1 / gene=Cvel_4599 / organism=Chromera_velia_CCMP2878 / gene_product=hypothetical protein / transcript_product=hypothetical protein / location=Cvel_scaffold202:25059-27860(-) / protein_length=354 / sequence_SO=supercontig / SO=protein_coding / is_pseudo=false